jgi:hypothetical protein
MTPLWCVTVRTGTDEKLDVYVRATTLFAAERLGAQTGSRVVRATRVKGVS